MGVNATKSKNLIILPLKLFIPYLGALFQATECVCVQSVANSERTYVHTRRPCQPTKGLHSTWKIAHSGAHGPCHFFKCSPSLARSEQPDGRDGNGDKEIPRPTSKDSNALSFCCFFGAERATSISAWLASRAPLLNKNARNFDTKSWLERNDRRLSKTSYIFQ